MAVRYVVEGGKPLHGEAQVSGSKNAALPILCATLLYPGETIIDRVPQITDVEQILLLLQDLGCQVRREGERIFVDATHAQSRPLPREKTSALRASVLLLGPLLGRFGEVDMGLPGGCAIGRRPIDYHVDVARQMGAEVQRKDGSVGLRVSSLMGGQVVLPEVSVGATENALLLAAAAQGPTWIYGAAREPEIYDLAGFLQQMGISVCGAGSDRILVCPKAMTATQYAVMPDRIEAGTLLAAAAGTHGKIFLHDADWRTMGRILSFFGRCGCRMGVEKGGLWLKAPKRLRACPLLLTKTYPGFPTDMQPLSAAVLTTAKGTSMIMEQIFENRFLHLKSLNAMGGRTACSGRVAVIDGVRCLQGCVVKATDLRAGAALVVAGLMAQGETVVENGQYIQRGYGALEQKIERLGGRIRLEEGR
ncbi:MAG TPA: UDP-N-acetylglucosamine 1-carboxyvinyltransferase [Firmicutes bacterium]|nr:UDP-N-acetylglucosamine 1-carboxyvinyltransferase [Bacillota bacterium]